MQAIVRAGGHQFMLTEGQEFDVGSLDGEPGDTLDFDVLMLIDGMDVEIGEPTVPGASLRARIAQHGKGPKLRFMKYKNKVRYRRTLGHRQPVTRLVVESITKG